MNDLKYGKNFLCMKCIYIAIDFSQKKKASDEQKLENIFKIVIVNTERAKRVKRVRKIFSTNIYNCDFLSFFTAFTVSLT